MSETSYLTPEGLKKLKDELNELKTKGRKDMANQIAEARDKGDLRENAEYDAAKEAQGLLELKISKLENTIANAKIVDPSKMDNSKVNIMSNVTIKNKANGMKLTYKIVAEEEADLAQGKISIKSPIGKGLIGKKLGDTAEIEAPAGKIQFEILEISIG